MQRHRHPARVAVRVGDQEQHGAFRLAHFPEAIERYLSSDSPGRLMRSLKAYLADRNFDGTSVYGRHLALTDLIAAFLKKLLEGMDIHGERGIKGILGQLQAIY